MSEEGNKGKFKVDDVVYIKGLLLDEFEIVEKFELDGFKCIKVKKLVEGVRINEVVYEYFESDITTYKEALSLTEEHLKEKKNLITNGIR